MITDADAERIAATVLAVLEPFLHHVIDTLERIEKVQQDVVRSLADRCAGQAEIIARRAEKR